MLCSRFEKLPLTSSAVTSIGQVLSVSGVLVNRYAGRVTRISLPVVTTLPPAASRAVASTLRSQEAVQSSLSLKTWLKAIERGENRLKVVFGTKGGRPRHTTVLDTGAVRKALEKALLVADRHNGRLIDKPDLKMALESWHKQVIKVGLKGEFSPHSLRYAWAQDAIRHYLAQGFSEKESLALTATDLGHGDGRGRWVKQVYGYRWREE